MARTIIDTTAGAGDTGKAGGDKLNAMTVELYAKADMLLGARKPRIATMGNSHSTKVGLVPAITYSLWRYYPADITFDYRGAYTETEAFNPAKGDVFGVGGTTTASMVTNQIPRIQAAMAARGAYDLVYIGDGGYNDTYASAATVATGVGNIVTTANALLAAGVRLVVILGVLPQAAGASSGISATWAAEANQLLRNYAAATQGVAFCEVTSLFANHAEASTFLNKRLGNVYGGFTIDGTHLSGNGRRLLAAELAKYHRAIARPRVPRNFGNQGTFDAANKPSINVLGDGAGNAQGTAGLKNSSFNTGVAGLSANSRLSVNDSNTANNVLTPSIVVGADGYTRQRLTLSGGAAAKGTTNIAFAAAGLVNLNNGVLARGYDFECVVELTNVTGLSDLFVRTNGAASDTPPFGDQAGGAVGDLWPDGTTETLFVYQTVPEIYAANLASVSPTMFFGFTADRPPSGTIDISRASFQRVTAD